MDFVISVCALAAAEPGLAWPGKPLVAHWGIGDPAAVQGQRRVPLRAFQRAYREIEGRIKLFVSLPVASLDKLTLSAELRRMEMGQPESRGLL
jgi:arsenate reductase